jgi:hypothetical protein
LFSAQSLPHQVDPGSFYGRTRAVSSQWFDDGDLKDMYCPDNGRPSLPPSLMSGVLLLEFYDDVSDGEAVECTQYDLRWKVAFVESHKVIPGKVSQSRTGLGFKSAKLRLVDAIKPILKRPECLMSPTLSSMSTFSPMKPARIATWHSRPAF